MRVKGHDSLRFFHIKGLTMGRIVIFLTNGAV